MPIFASNSARKLQYLAFFFSDGGEGVTTLRLAIGVQSVWEWLRWKTFYHIHSRCNVAKIEKWYVIQGDKKDLEDLKTPEEKTLSKVVRKLFSSLN